MIPRYSTKKMDQIWSEENKFKVWLDVEEAVIEAFVSTGKIPKEDFDKIKKNSRIDIKRIGEIETETKHDVIAFTRSISETLGDEKKWIHYGLTSTDVVDTAQALRFKESNTELKKDLDNLIEALKNISIENKYVPTIGRTHGVHAEPTSFGLIMLRFYSEMKRNKERFNRVSSELEVGKLSGSVGNNANISSEVEEKALKILGLKRLEVGSQVIPRDLHADFINTIAIIASGLDSLAIELRTLQRTEIQETQEFFGNGQKGSSSMPHKKNPIGLENISGLSRVLRSYIIPALEDIPLWNERDISHSSVERIIFPDSAELLSYSLKRMTKIITNLKVNRENMLKNISKTNGLVFSQRVLNKLIDKGLSREESYDLVQPITQESWNENKDFKELLKENKKVSSLIQDDEFDELFSTDFYLKSVDDIFGRFF